MRGAAGGLDRGCCPRAARCGAAQVRRDPHPTLSPLGRGGAPRRLDRCANCRLASIHLPQSSRACRARSRTTDNRTCRATASLLPLGEKDQDEGRGGWGLIAAAASRCGAAQQRRDPHPNPLSAGERGRAEAAGPLRQFPACLNPAGHDGRDYFSTGTSEKCGSAARHSATGRPSSLRTMLVPRTRATTL